MRPSCTTRSICVYSCGAKPCREHDPLRHITAERSKEKERWHLSHPITLLCGCSLLAAIREASRFCQGFSREVAYLIMAYRWKPSFWAVQRMVYIEWLFTHALSMPFHCSGIKRLRTCSAIMRWSSVNKLHSCNQTCEWTPSNHPVPAYGPDI